MARFRKVGVATTTAFGHFDVVEYDSELHVLTIIVRPSFAFDPYVPAMGTDPDLLAQLPTFLANMRSACKDTFKAMVEAWGGWHRFVCNEPDVNNLYVTVRCEVDELPADHIQPGTQYTPVIFGNVGARAHAKHSVNVDFSDGYRSMGGVTAFPILPHEYLAAYAAAQLGLPPPVYPHYTLMHEIGHIFGLGDEYVSADPNYPDYTSGQPTYHTALAMQELGKNVYHGWNDKSIMAFGGEIMDVHGVCFLQALRDVTGLKWKFA